MYVCHDGQCICVISVCVYMDIPCVDVMTGSSVFMLLIFVGVYV